MAVDRKTKKKVDLKRYAKAALPAAVVSGLSYGVARTAMEKFFADPVRRAKYGPGFQRYAPPVAAVLGGAAAHQINKRLRKASQEPDKPHEKKAESTADWKRPLARGVARLAVGGAAGYGTYKGVKRLRKKRK